MKAVLLKVINIEIVKCTAYSNTGSNTGMGALCSVQPECTYGVQPIEV